MSDIKADGVCDCCARCVLSSIFCDERTGDGSPRAYTLTRSRVVPVGRSCASCEAWLADRTLHADNPLLTGRLLSQSMCDMRQGLGSSSGNLDH